jgi:hypothetical protein
MTSVGRVWVPRNGIEDRRNALGWPSMPPCESHIEVGASVFLHTADSGKSHTETIKSAW